MRSLTFILIAGVLIALAGCGGGTDIAGPTAGGAVHVAIAPGGSDFSVVLQTAVQSGAQVAGPFLLKGSNIHYDEGIGALVVDLTVTNTGRTMLPLPVRIEFTALSPDGITVLNPSNGVYGVGARVEFEFLEKDLRWAPGEESLPRSVQFGVDDGQSIGFAVRLLVGPDAEMGTISGVVWKDADESGTREPGEPGVPDRTIVLSWADSLIDCVPEVDCPRIATATTGADGRYSFDELGAGFYTVVLVRDRCSIPTTPTQFQVILVETATGIAGFEHADFGVKPIRCDP